MRVPLAQDRESMSKSLQSLLEPFYDNQAPSTSRVDPSVQTKKPEPIGLRNAYQYVPFVVNQAKSIATTLFHHQVYGPPKKSWGLEMSLFTTFLRASAAYSHLTDMSMLRKFIHVGAILPAPKDGIVTPVSFKVKRRGLKGFLKEWDDKEDGTRELTGEWVITRRLWRSMQEDYKGKDVNGREKVILYVHGGAYFSMNAQTHRPLTIALSKYTDTRLFVVNYRLSPEFLFPAPLHDIVASYLRLIHDLKIPPEDIIFAGDSAGGGLALATMLYLKDEGYPLPLGAMLMSPWVDLTMSSDSWEKNAPWDYIPQVMQDDHLHPVKLYLGANIEKYLTHPYASPIFGDFKGLPPLLIQAGDAEVLRDEATLIAHKASLAGVPVVHEIYEDAVHVFQAFLFLEASKKALRSMREFVHHLKRRKPSEPSSQLNKQKVDEEIFLDAHRIQEDGKASGRRLVPRSSSSTTLKDQRQPPLTSLSDEEDNTDSDDEVDSSEEGEVEGRRLEPADSGESSFWMRSPIQPLTASMPSRETGDTTHHAPQPGSRSPKHPDDVLLQQPGFGFF
ncbi:hypothetical protein BT69DRAFT_1283758 [Atractiella rhizophila]|nr:hypothetical protein BT69DRAFT_1283758 [Atractiella rhizophila]